MHFNKFKTAYDTQHEAIEQMAEILKQNHAKELAQISEVYRTAKVSWLGVREPTPEADNALWELFETVGLPAYDDDEDYVTTNARDQLSSLALHE